MNTDTKTCQSTIKELAQFIKDEDISPVELTEIFLERIEKLNDKINAFISIRKEGALKEAKEAQEKLKSGEYLGPLHGIPISVKDLFAQKGTRTTAGSRILSNNVTEYDSAVVERLRNRGAVIIGKNNMAEFAYHVTNHNQFYGDVKNPWDLNKITGGSSGGSTAAVVSSMCAASIGSDTGGSIRIPSSLCGTVGLKPTYGRVSLFGAITLSWSLDHVGPTGKSVSDVAMILEAIAGRDERDPTSSKAKVAKYYENLDCELKGSSSTKIAILREFFYDETVNKEVSEYLSRAVELFKELGAQVEELSMPEMSLARRLAMLIMSPEASSYHEKYLKNNKNDYGKDTLQRLTTGMIIPATLYLKAQRIRSQMIEEFGRLSKEVDAIIIPATPITAPNSGVEEIDYDGKMIPVRSLLPKFTTAFNLLGLPAISIPCGFTGDGMPVGMQIVGKAFQEERILQLAHKYESATEWHLRRPSV